MAKGSLAGTADPTLVKMAYAVALGNVPGDYSDYYKQMVTTHKELVKGIQDHATAFAVQKQIDVAALDTAMSAFDQPLSLQAIDADHDMMYAEVENQRDIWEANKGFDGDAKGLADWNRKNGQIITKYKSNQQELVNIKAAYDAGNYATDQMEKGDLNFMTNVSQYQANKNGQSGTFNALATDYMSENPDATVEEMWENLGVVNEGEVVKYNDPTTGEYVYVSKVVNQNGEEEIKSVKSNDLKSTFDKHLKADNVFLEVQELNSTVAEFSTTTEDGYDKYSSNYRNKLESIIDAGAEKNENTLRYLMGKKTDTQKMSFDQALRSGLIPVAGEIINTLETTEGWLGDDGDGVLDQGDFATVENYNAVVDNILNGEIDKQSPGTGKKMYLDYTEDTLFTATHNLYKKKPGKVEEGNYMVNQVQMDAATFNKNYKPHVNFLNAGTTGKTDGNWNIKTAPNETLYRGSDEEGWEMKTKQETAYTPATKSEVAATIGLNMSHGLNFETTGGARETELAPPTQAEAGAVTQTTDTSVNYQVGLVSDYSDKPDMTAGSRADDAISRLDVQTEAGAYAENWTQMDDNEAAPILNSAFGHLGLEFIYRGDNKDEVIVRDKDGKALGKLSVDNFGVNKSAIKKLKAILEKMYQLDMDS